MATDPSLTTEHLHETRPERPAFVAIRIPLRLIGLMMMLVLIFLFAALASWSVDDPSLSFATDKSPSNWMGLPGAVLADISMQFFGLASLIILVPPLVWAWNLVAKRSPDNWPLRLVTWIAAALLGAGALSCLPIPQSWPLPTGLGGLVGSGFTSLARFVTGSAPEGAAAILYALILTPPALVLLRISTAMQTAAQNPQITDELNESGNGDPTIRESDRTGFFDIVFGAIVHLALSARTAWRRVWQASAARRAQQADMEWQRQTARPDSDPVAPVLPLGEETPFERREPRFTGASLDPEENGNLQTGTFEGETLENAGFAQEDVASPRPHTTPAGEYPDDHLARLNVEQAGPAAPNPAPNPAPGFVAPRNASAPAPHAAPASVRPAAKIKPGARQMREAQGSLLQEEGFQLPQLSLLSPPAANTISPEHHPDELEIKARQLEGVLEDFGIKGDIINVRPGPVVTLYELEPAPGIKSSRVISLADDIARSMSAISARVAVVPGRNAIGIELPNASRETVFLREMLASSDFEKMKGKLPICLGKTIGGEPVIADLARMPHLLIAGTTGSGKSVAVNTMILSLLYRMTPEQCRLIMIDPKMLELSIYDGIPHLLSPVVTDPGKAVVALKWAVREMEDRYRKMSKIGVRNIEGFNSRVNKANKKGETITRTVQTGFDRETGEAIYESETFELEPLPYIVVIVDEMADLMMVAGKDIEGAIQRLAQMARAAGIHLIMATQRPSVDVITGTIKANFPTRISFQVTSKIDSRTILGEQGAEQLLGMGDMLYMAGGGRVRRLHGPFVADAEVEDVVAHLKEQGAPDYLDSVTEETEETSGEATLASSGDELYDKAVNIVLNDRKASTSYIQRRLSIGYNRAATLIERMENEGVISPANHAGKREVLVGDGVEH